MDAAYKKYTRPQSVKLNFIEKCSNMKVKHPKDYWLEYERKMLENINETRAHTADILTIQQMSWHGSRASTIICCMMIFQDKQINVAGHTVRCEQ